MFKSLSNFGRSASSKTWPNDVAELNLLEATGTQIQRLLSEGKVTSSKLVDQFLDQIEKHNKYLKAVIQVTPLDKLHDRANYLDAERGSGRLRGELHGIPILVKVGYRMHQQIILTSYRTTLVPPQVWGSRQQQDATL